MTEWQGLEDSASELAQILVHGHEPAPLFSTSEIRCETFRVLMRDGVALATDVYLPPDVPAPSVVLRTPYGRTTKKHVELFFAFARCGYVVVAQDCRGTGGSEPDEWDYYMYESEDGYDLVEWITLQSWFDGFLGAFGGSYAGQTQWCMAVHPAMTTIAPEVSGLGVAINTARLHMFLNSYARSVGKGARKVTVPHVELERLMLEETLAEGYFNEPLNMHLPEAALSRYPDLRTLSPALARQRLWERYCALTCSQRAAFIREALNVNAVGISEVESLPAIFGHGTSHDAHTLPHVDKRALGRSIRASPLMITGWYDWGLNDALATWQLIRSAASKQVRENCRLIITPGAHNSPGYHEGAGDHPELRRTYRTLGNVGLLLKWYSTVRGREVRHWPAVIYYLLGANEWKVASDWPPPTMELVDFYLRTGGELSRDPPVENSRPDCYIYDPENPTPTVGGSILSSVYPPGSVDVGQVQRRADVLTYTTDPLTKAMDAVGPLRLVLYASSSAVDTDFVARLTDVFPDGRAIQLQNGILRARYRDFAGSPELLEVDQVCQFEIDMWATANRFEVGHCIRLDISSADFPRYDRNANRGGVAGPPVCAAQKVFHDPDHPSRLVLPVLHVHSDP